MYRSPAERWLMGERCGELSLPAENGGNKNYGDQRRSDISDRYGKKLSCAEFQFSGVGYLIRRIWYAPYPAREQTDEEAAQMHYHLIGHECEKVEKRHVPYRKLRDSSDRQ